MITIIKNEKVERKNVTEQIKNYRTIVLLKNKIIKQISEHKMHIANLKIYYEMSDLIIAFLYFKIR